VCCACRKSHSRMLRHMSVFMEYATEAFVSAYVEMSDLHRVDDR
jgi:hypothetical protein